MFKTGKWRNYIYATHQLAFIRKIKSSPRITSPSLPIWFIGLMLVTWPFPITKVKVSHVWLFATPCTIAYQAPLSMGILQARILEWVAYPFSRGSSSSGIELGSPALQVDSLPDELPEKPGTIPYVLCNCFFFMQHCLWNLIMLLHMNVIIALNCYVSLYDFTIIDFIPLLMGI